MPKVMKTITDALNSEFSIDIFDGKIGLILESWGPVTRNPEYNDAFDLIIERLASYHVPYICVNVISRKIIELFPDEQSRRIIINGSYKIDIISRQPDVVRKEIGAKQAELKENPASTGGNRTKRIFIYNECIDRALWTKIALAQNLVGSFQNVVEAPTADHEQLEASATIISKQNIQIPQGIPTPTKETQSREVFLRSPKIRGWLIANAKGFCENCCKPSPFNKDDGEKYLEIHHICRLSDGGSDDIDNAVAVCPNCHREFHYGEKRHVIIADIKSRVKRLK